MATAHGDCPSVDQNHTPAEEVANIATSLVGCLLAVAGLVALIGGAERRGTAGDRIALAVYGVTLVLLYLASTLYHAARRGWTKGLFKLFDHSAIFLLIAGTYTPFTLLALRGGWGVGLCIAVWVLALAGIALKLRCIHCYEKPSLVLYLVMGWLGLIAAGPIAERVSADCLLWLAAGGAAYTGGVVFYVWERLPFNHAVWHLFVLAGSACHYVSVFTYMVPAAA